MAFTYKSTRLQTSEEEYHQYELQVIFTIDLLYLRKQRIFLENEMSR
jgi:hypothetical protein